MLLLYTLSSFELRPSFSLRKNSAIRSFEELLQIIYKRLLQIRLLYDILRR